VFEHLSQVWTSIDGKMKSESFKQKVLNCVKAWDDWAIYPAEFLLRLQNMFLGLVNTKPKIIDNIQKANKSTAEDNDDSDIDVDGKPLEEEENDNNKKSCIFLNLKSLFNYLDQLCISRNLKHNLKHNFSSQRKRKICF
jgi:hypothetical protein